MVPEDGDTKDTIMVLGSWHQVVSVSIVCVSIHPRRILSVVVQLYGGTVLLYTEFMTLILIAVGKGEPVYRFEF